MSYHSLKASYRAKAVFVVNDQTVKAIRKLKDGNGQYRWTRFLATERLDGYDELLRGFIRAAVDYAEQYQKVQYGRRNLPPSAEQAVIMLASHYYNARTAIDRLLNMHKKWEV
ncbi:hypothetical protein FACS18949_12460 [Clostridia bacterium]|nr:hypothetical protein FACS189425_08480 [Clostridia bacterium]GHV35126.1 hypothetical protein FACS18949_12460 [Clostridia bacterium]